VVTVLFLVAAPSEQRPSASLFDVSNFIHKSAIRTALNAKMCAPFRLLEQHPMTKKAKKVPNVMLTPKNTQKPRPAAIAHLNERDLVPRSRNHPQERVWPLFTSCTLHTVTVPHEHLNHQS
jgi:hypothetical protein